MLDEILQIIAEDEETLQGLFDEIDDLKFAQREAVEDVLDRWLTSAITDDNGFLIRNALSEEEIDRFEEELKSFYSQDFMNDMFEQTVQRIERRLETIDQIYEELELEEAILGEDVFEMEAVNDEIDTLARSFVDAREGDEDHKGGVERIEDAMRRYRFDRSKDEFTLRDELRETLRKETTMGANYTNSMAITSMANIDRRLRRTQALQANINYGLYLGPYDDIIRDFCDEWIGKVETWQFWDALTNDMPEGLFDHPASIHCGGINCRHRIIAWKLEWSDGEQDLREQVISGDTVAPPPEAAFETEDEFEVDPRIEEDHGIEVDERFKREMAYFFEKDNDLKVSIRQGTDSMYKPSENRIYFNKDKMNEQTIYHEYGHAMHYKTNMITTMNLKYDTKERYDQFYEDTVKGERLRNFKPSILDTDIRRRKVQLQDQAREAFQNDNDALVAELQAQYDELYDLADMLAALTEGNYGFGHKKSYWRDINNADKMEFLAHMFENRYGGMNSFIDEMAPEFRQIIEEDFDDLMQDLIAMQQ